MTRLRLVESVPVRITDGRIAAAIAVDRMRGVPTPLTALAERVAVYLAALERWNALKVETYHHTGYDGRTVTAINEMDAARLALVASIDARPSQLVDNLAREIRRPRDLPRPSWIARLWQRLTGGR